MRIIKTEELAHDEIAEETAATITISLPKVGSYIFTGVKHFQIFVEEEVTPKQFGVKELCLVNQEFELAVFKLVLRRLAELTEGGSQE